MATSSGHRVAAFFLALLFLMTTVGATAYVLWQINQDEGALVNTDTEGDSTTAQTDERNSCGSKQYEAVTPRSIPTITTAQTPVSELSTIDISVGGGEEVQPGDCVAALYYGTLASSGAKFDGNYETGTPIEFSLNGVITGWTEGIPGMKVGGVRRLVIPAAMAYGESGSGDVIPPNSDLVFEVEIVSARRGDQ